MTLINSPINQQVCTYMQNGFRTDINKTSFPLGFGMPMTPFNYYNVYALSNVPTYKGGNVTQFNNWTGPGNAGFMVAPWNVAPASGGSIPLNTVPGNNFQYTATNPATNVTKLYNGITLDVPRCLVFYTANSVTASPFAPILDAASPNITNTGGTALEATILGLDYRNVLMFETLSLPRLSGGTNSWGGGSSCDLYPCYFSNKAYAAVLDISFNRAPTLTAVAGSTPYIGVGISNVLGLPFFVPYLSYMSGNVIGPYASNDSANEINFPNIQAVNATTSINNDLFLGGLDFYNQSPRDLALAAQDPYNPGSDTSIDARGLVSFTMNDNDTPFNSQGSFFAACTMYCYGADTQVAAQIANEAVPTSVNINSGYRIKVGGAYGGAHTGVYPTPGARWDNQVQLTSYDLVGVQYPGDYPDFLRVKPGG